MLVRNFLFLPFCRVSNLRSIGSPFLIYVGVVALATTLRLYTVEIGLLRRPEPRARKSPQPLLCYLEHRCGAKGGQLTRNVAQEGRPQKSPSKSQAPSLTTIGAPEPGSHASDSQPRTSLPSEYILLYISSTNKPNTARQLFQ
jgi:hypothetical protein